MNADQYRQYVACFNGRDYDGLHAFFAEDVVLQVSGYEIRGKSGIARFYEFFHDHVRETVTVRRFVEGGDLDFADVVIRFEGLKELTAERLASEGFAKMMPVPAGATVEIALFIAYGSRAGKIEVIRCAIFEPPLPE